GGRQACPPAGRLSPRRRRSAPPPGGRRRGDPRARGLARLPADGVTPAHRDDPRAGAPGWLTLPQGTGPGSPVSVGGPRVLPHCAPPPTSTRLSLAVMTATRARREVPPMRRLPLLMLSFLGALVTAPPAPAERPQMHLRCGRSSRADDAPPPARSGHPHRP